MLTGRTHQVSEVALLVNESVRKKQNLEQLAELEKRLMGKYPVRHPPVGISPYRMAHLSRCRMNQKNMTQAGRVLIHEGELTKLCRKVPKKVHLAFLCVCTVALSADLFLSLSFFLFFSVIFSCSTICCCTEWRIR